MVSFLIEHWYFVKWWRHNVRHQARQTAGATQERTLFAVACMPLLGELGTDCRLYRPPQEHVQPQEVPFGSVLKS